MIQFTNHHFNAIHRFRANDTNQSDQRAEYLDDKAAEAAQDNNQQSSDKYLNESEFERTGVDLEQERDSFNSQQQQS